MLEVKNKKKWKLKVFHTNKDRIYLFDQFRELCEENKISKYLTKPETP